MHNHNPPGPHPGSATQLGVAEAAAGLGEGPCCVDCEPAGAVRPQPEFPSTFPPPDAGPHGMGRNGQGRRVTLEAGDTPFVHVTGHSGGEMGMGRDPRGDRGAACKIAGIAYTGSNPVPATLPLTSNNVVSGRPVKSGSRTELPSGFPPPDAGLTPTAWSAPLGRRHPRSVQPAGGAVCGSWWI